MADEANHDVAGLPAVIGGRSGVNIAADPCNKLLWRKAPLRLEAETIRDSMLQVSGLLNREMFGKQEPIKRGADGQWLEDDKKGTAESPEPVSGAEAHAPGELPAHVRLSRYDVGQPVGAVPLVAAHPVAGADEQSAGDADVEGVRAAGAGTSARATRSRRWSWRSTAHTRANRIREELEIARRVDREVNGPEGRTAAVHPGDVWGEQFPVQLLSIAQHGRRMA